MGRGGNALFVGLSTLRQGKSKGNTVLRCWVWDRAVNWPTAFSCKLNIFFCEQNIRLWCRHRILVTPWANTGVGQGTARYQWCGGVVRSTELGACLGVCAGSKDSVGFGRLRGWMEVLWNDTGDTEGESTEDRAKEFGGYCNERVESTQWKELGCEKLHRHNEGWRVFCLESIRCLWHISLGKHILLIQLFSSSTMY